MKILIEQIYFFTLAHDYKIKNLWVRREWRGGPTLITPPMDIFEGDIRLDKFFKEQYG